MAALPVDPSLRHPVHKALHAPLVVWQWCGGIERFSFVGSWFLGAVTSQLAGSFLVGGAITVGLLVVSWCATRYDPQLVPIILGNRSKRRYDPCKYDGAEVRRV